MKDTQSVAASFICAHQRSFADTPFFDRADGTQQNNAF
jgi:hypothetical protein